MNVIVQKWSILIVSLKYILYSVGEPNKRNLDYICAYIYGGKFYNDACTTLKRVICEIDGKRYALVDLNSIS